MNVLNSLNRRKTMAKRGTAPTYENNELLDELIKEAITEEEPEEVIEDEVKEDIKDDEEVIEDEIEPSDEADDKAEEESKDKEDEPEKKKKKVPLAELIKERKARQELEARLKETEGKMGKYDELWARLDEQEKARKAAEEAEPVPDFDEDPTGNLKHSQEKMKADFENAKKQFQDQNENLQQQQFYQQVGQTVTRSEQTFVKDNDDYYDAVNHLRGVMRSQVEPLLRAKGISDEAQINQYIQQQEAQAAVQLVMAGIDPAEYTYNYAKTVGYTKKEAEKVDDNKVDDDLDRKQKGLDAAKGGSGGSGKKVTKEFVDGATPAEFDAAMAEMFGKQ
jgi:hypothetical protein